MIEDENQRLQRLMQLFKKESATILGLDLKREGHFAFFKAACYDSNGINADLQRQELHAILDQILDAEAEKISIMRRLGA